MKTTFRHEVVEQLSAFNILENEISMLQNRQQRLYRSSGYRHLQLRLGLPNIVESHNVRVFNELHNDDFSLNTQESLVLL